MPGQPDPIGGYTGRVVRVPLGKEGLTYSKNPSTLPPSGLLQADTITYSEDSCRKAPGRALFGRYMGPAVGQSIFSIYDWLPGEGTQYTVTLSSAGKVYIAPATSVQLDLNETTPPGTTTPTRAIFVTAGGEKNGSERMLVIFTSIGLPGFYQGTSPAPGKIATPPTDWTAPNFPVSGAVHNGRLFAWGNPNAPHSIYGSTIDDHQDFVTGVEIGTASPSSATYHRVHPGVGVRLYCGYSHKGMLFLLKHPNGVFFLDDSDINPQGWKCNMISDAMGVPPTPFAGIVLDDGVMFMSASGQFFLITATSQGGITITDLSTRMYLDQWLQKNVNIAQLAKVVAVWDPTMKIAHFAVPSVRDGVASLTNDLLLSFDFRAFTKGEAKVRFAYQYRDTIQSLALRRNPSSFIYKPIQASYEVPGRAYEMEQDDRSLNSADPGATPVLTGYQSIFQINHTDLSEYVDQPSAELATMNKNWDWLGIEYVPSTGGDIEVIQYVDGVAQPTVTTTLIQNGPRLAPAPGFTEFTIYSGVGSTVASELAGGTTAGLDLRVKWVRLVGTGRRISIEIRSSSVASEDIFVTGLYIGYRIAGQDVGRGQGSN